MTTTQWTPVHEPMSRPLNERVTGGRGIWLIGRVLLGGLFLMSGAQKLLGLDQFAAMLVKSGIPENIVPVLAPLAAGVETLGGLLVVLGVATSWGALLLALFTLVATFIGHRFWEFQGEVQMLQMANFMKNIMIVGAFCLLYVSGGGPCSIDRWWRDRAKPLT